MTSKEHRILVVDDSPAILTVMKAIFQELRQNQVSYFDNSVQALEKLRQTPHLFDLVFTDLKMPDIDGMELIRELGRLHYQGGIIIVSDMEPKVIDLASDLARQHHTHLIGNISKPISLPEVKLMLHKYELMHNHHVRPAVRLTRLQLLDSIRRKQIQPFYQPKVDASKGRISGVEVTAKLLCDAYPEPLSANEFIPLAQSYDLLNLITFQLLEQAAPEFKEILQTLGEDVKFGFNLHPSQLADLSCTDKLCMLLSLNGLSPDQIIIEISEHRLSTDPAQLETINRLKINGFQIAIDDFGCGYISHQQLQQLPLDEIKLAQSLIADIKTDRFNQTIISHLVELAGSNHLTLVADGVENNEEMEYLARHFPGILVQGYIYTEPRTLRDFLSWCKNEKQRLCYH